MKETLQSAYERLTRPSWITLGVAVSILVVYVALALTLTPSDIRRWMSVYPGYERLNENYYIFDRLSEIQQATKNDKSLSVAVVGGSTTRESLTNGRDLAERLGKALSRNVDVYDLASSGQHLSTSLYIADYLSCTKHFDAIVLGVSVARIAGIQPDRQQINLLRGYGIIAPNQGAVDKTIDGPNLERRFVAASLSLMAKYVLHSFTRIRLEGVRSKRLSVDDRHAFLSRGLTHEEVTKKVRAAQTRHVGRFNDHSAEGMDLILQAAQKARSCGSTMIFLDTPLNPIVFQETEFSPYAAAFRKFRSDLSTRANAANVPVIALNDPDLLTPQDFHDFGHLRDRQAMERTTGRITARLQETLGGQDR